MKALTQKRMIDRKIVELLIGGTGVKPIARNLHVSKIDSLVKTPVLWNSLFPKHWENYSLGPSMPPIFISRA